MTLYPFKNKLPIIQQGLFTNVLLPWQLEKTIIKEILLSK